MPSGFEVALSGVVTGSEVRRSPLIPETHESIESCAVGVFVPIPTYPQVSKTSEDHVSTRVVPESVHFAMEFGVPVPVTPGEYELHCHLELPEL